jgi:hypothetical protein
VGLLAAAARLERFELVTGLEQETVEVGFISQDSIDGGGVGDDAELLVRRLRRAVEGRRPRPLSP